MRMPVDDGSLKGPLKMKRLAVEIDEWSADDVAEEILDVSKKDIDLFIKNLINSGQTVNAAVDKALRVALERADMDPDAFYEGGGRKALEEKVAKAIDRHWGKDAMATLLVKLIVSGDFVS